MPTLTPNQAAKKLGISRRTIMRAIEQHKIHAIRDNRNQWQIDDADIAHWVRSEHAQPIAQATLIPAHPIHEMQMRIAVLEAELKAATSIIDDLKKDRDAWREQIQNLSRPWWKKIVL